MKELKFQIPTFIGGNVWNAWECNILDTFPGISTINQTWECHISNNHILRYVHILKNLTFPKLNVTSNFHEDMSWEKVIIKGWDEAHDFPCKSTTFLISQILY